MKVVLEYTDCLEDGKNVFYTLSKYDDVQILNSTNKLGTIYQKITIRINSQNELKKLICDLRNNCIYTVKVLSVKSEDNFFERIKRIFE